MTSTSMPETGKRGESARGIALKLIILLGITSLLGSMVSNGAHSVTGPFLLSLGGSAAVVGLVAGAGDFIGYALRLITGPVLAKTRYYWTVTIIGYSLLAAIPLLALAGSWEVAALLIILERVGKAIRAPSRDSILSHATAEMGRGKGFGIHKTLDQAGAITGPLILMAALLMNGGYSEGFAILGIPLIFMFAVLLFARRLVPSPDLLETEPKIRPDNGINQRICMPYGVYIFLVMAGFVNFPLLSYHLASQSLVPVGEIPLLFSIAMLCAGVIAFATGHIYDRKGITLMALFPIINVIAPILIFFFGYTGILFGIVIWGGSLGMQAMLLRVIIADFTQKQSRGTAYGIMNALFGTAWFIGSVVMGVLYDVSLIHVAAYIIIVECLSVPVFVWLLHSRTKSDGSVT